ncbi:hypothetical protein [Rhizobium sp. RU36D]|uniref:hypothetical protein n=1 Tax=Rhizobium sp. RU36D TaxID=1907415 RepID=UPI0009D8D350|nr:hypothetical protein [Rhizobium sp. RU36D]SMD20117.1 hypothetical protein SAMN05880593_14815 [Rhizobium sp. RU36D]
MTVALYADYIADLRDIIAELDGHPERFQTYSLHVAVTAAGSLIVYETKRRRGQIDSIYYGRPAGAQSNRQVSQATAFAAIERFFGLGQFVALKAEAGSQDVGATGLAVQADYPYCAVNFTYRKKGQPDTRSMMMIFIGFNDDADAFSYAAMAGTASPLVSERPHRSERLFEWK